MFYCMDAAEGLAQIDDGAIKLVYGSPPYPNADRDYGRWTGPEWLEMMQRHIAAVVPKLRADGFLVVNMKACREPPPKSGISCRKRWVERLLIWVEDTMPELWAVDDEIWVKANPVTTGLRAAAQDAWEGIYVWARSNPWTWNMDAVRREYSQATLDKYEHGTWKPAQNGLGYFTKEKHVQANPLGALPFNVVTGGSGSPVEKQFLHQARQPEYLPERYIKAFTERGDLVWDMWMGSGTTLAVATRLGRLVGGTDALPQNVAMVQQRIYPRFGT